MKTIQSASLYNHVSHSVILIHKKIIIENDFLFDIKSD